MYLLPTPTSKSHLSILKLLKSIIYLHHHVCAEHVLQMQMSLLANITIVIQRIVKIIDHHDNHHDHDGHYLREEDPEDVIEEKPGEEKC